VTSIFTLDGREGAMRRFRRQSGMPAAGAAAGKYRGAEPAARVQGRRQPFPSSASIPENASDIGATKTDLDAVIPPCPGTARRVAFDEASSLPRSAASRSRTVTRRVALAGSGAATERIDARFFVSRVALDRTAPLRETDMTWDEV